MKHIFHMWNRNCYFEGDDKQSISTLKTNILLSTSTSVLKSYFKITLSFSTIMLSYFNIAILTSTITPYSNNTILTLTITPYFNNAILTSIVTLRLLLQHDYVLNFNNFIVNISWFYNDHQPTYQSFSYCL